jgi:anti-sigma regulatory factor (Ser/Thr protein kinase)
LIAVQEVEIGVVEITLGVKDHGQRGHAETVPIVAKKRAQRRGYDIRATADGFGEDDIRLRR